MQENLLHLPASLSHLAQKVIRGERITPSEAVELGSQAPLALMGLLAVHAKERQSGSEVFYNKNFHLEPTNICVFNCKFCSYRRPANSPEAWDYSFEEILAQVEARRKSGATEIHIVGGVHPTHELYYYTELIRAIHAILPTVAIKAFTAIELRYMIQKAGLTLEAGLTLLKEAGMAAIPGGGAEIFAERIRQQICPEKGSAEDWLEVHQVAHELAIPTNATMLYGHIESLEERIDHLERLRQLQDQTGGFNAFIPLKYRHTNNPMGANIAEVGIVEDLRMMALSRIYLDNIRHIKAYWPMFGKTTAQLSLAFGADDLDGTIDDSTRIYSMAGAEEHRPTMSTREMEDLIRGAGYLPVERDTFYHCVKK